MLKFALGFALIAFSTQSVAQNALGRIQVASPVAVTTALPGSLHDTMKAMSRAMKSIAVDDTSKNTANAEAADAIAALAIHSKKFVPEAITEMPAAQRGAALADYQNMMDQVAVTSRSMADAFRKGDNKKASALYDQLNAEKKRGHGEYK